MNESVPDCLIIDYEGLIPSLTDINQKDRHVVAAAIRGRVDVIVTFNLADFPRAVLMSWGIDVLHPDQFISDLVRLDLYAFCEVIKRLRSGLRSPPVGPEEYLSILTVSGLRSTSFDLQKFVGII